MSLPDNLRILTDNDYSGIGADGSPCFYYGADHENKGEDEFLAYQGKRVVRRFSKTELQSVTPDRIHSDDGYLIIGIYLFFTLPPTEE